jgi:hypothetical protein
MTVEEFSGQDGGGLTTVLKGSANEITVEASLGKMYDEGRKAGRVDGINETIRLYEPRIAKARAQGIEEGMKQEKARRREKKLAKQYRDDPSGQY